MKPAKEWAMEIGLAMTHPDAPVCGPKELTAKVGAIREEMLERAASEVEGLWGPEIERAGARAVLHAAAKLIRALKLLREA